MQSLNDRSEDDKIRYSYPSKALTEQCSEVEKVLWILEAR